MAILNYTTSIDYDKTVSEIQLILVKHGATKISVEYKDKLPSAIFFFLEMPSKREIAFALPFNYQGVLKAMQKDKKVPNYLCNQEQALRVSCRILKDWVQAQTAIVEAELADMAEIFLPYAITKNGITLYQELGNSNNTLLIG